MLKKYPIVNLVAKEIWKLVLVVGFSINVVIVITFTKIKLKLGITMNEIRAVINLIIKIPKDWLALSEALERVSAYGELVL